MLERQSRVHLVGIGGIGMSAIALLLARLGHEVAGSDLKASSQTERLKELGARVFIGEHRAGNLGDAELVITSSAVAQDNEEVREAGRRGIPVVHRGDVLAELMTRQKGIAVAGSHGKTTTAAMIAVLLVDAGRDPSCLVGGVVAQLGGNARLGRGEFLVAETDESDRSFLKLRPQMAVITNIDLEHMATYRDEEDLVSSFQEFIARLPDPSQCVLCLEDARIRRILSRIPGKPVTYGLKGNSAELTAECLEQSFYGSTFRVWRKGRIWGDVRLHVAGSHNILNSLSVIGISLLLGIAPEATLQSLSRFEGVARRMERKGAAGGVVFYDDYAHHPTEIRATLSAARKSDRRLVVIFQPHRYTRTREAFADFATCFEDADVLFLLDIYPAGEAPLAGITASRLAEEVMRAGHDSVQFVPKEGAVRGILSSLKKGDLLLTLGAGDVYTLGEEILGKWSVRHGGRS
ncbi:MAG: UDP-N-acetylmuramate--L-alanine ligase [Acidobacteria bacterium]|nr:UDP-N-acetylmuramate--L-alanine ligase [Acidobacteriota bacterium]